MSSQTKSGRRGVLKDNSWIRRNAEEDEPVDNDPNFGKLVLGQQKSVDDVSSFRKPVEAEKPAVNSGTSFSSLSKRFSGSQELLNNSSATSPPPAAKPPVPAKNPGLKSPSASGFTARVFSGANTSSNTLSPVKPSFGEKFPEVTAPQTTNGSVTPPAVRSSVTPPPVRSSVTPPAVRSSVTPPAVRSSVTPPAVKSSVTPPAVKSSVTSPAVKSSVTPPAVRSPTRSGSVSVSTLLSKTSTPPVSQTTVTNTSSSSSSSALDEALTASPAEKPSASLNLRDVSYSPSAVTLNTRYSSQTYSAPLDDLADSLMPTRSGSVQSVRSQTVYTEIPSPSATLHSPLQTLESSSRPVSSRDYCTVCGKPIAGAERMILEELKIISHTSCFRCAVCRCDLGGLEAGKSLWVYRERVNCSNCFSKTRGQWYI